MCFQKNLWKFKQILKILFKILKVFKKFFESFKKNVNKPLEKLNENYNFLQQYYLFLLLAEAWVVPHPLQLFRGFRGAGKLPPSPSQLRHWRTLYSVQWNFPIFPIFNPMQINMQLILTVFPLVEEGKIMRCFDMP